MNVPDMVANELNNAYGYYEHVCKCIAAYLLIHTHQSKFNGCGLRGMQLCICKHVRSILCIDLKWKKISRRKDFSLFIHIHNWLCTAHLIN